MARMGASVVPAKLQVRVDEAGAKEIRPERNQVDVARTAAKGSFNPARKAEVIPASAVQHRAKAPMLVRTSLTADGMVPQPLFVVMQTEVVRTRQYDASGAVVWDLCVWRVTVVGPVQNKLETGIAAKSI